MLNFSEKLCNSLLVGLIVTCFPLSYASGEELSVELFVVQESVLCKGSGFKNCLKVNQSNVDDVVLSLRNADASSLELVIPPNRIRMNQSQNHRSKLISLKVIYDKLYKYKVVSDFKAAAFLLDFPKGDVNQITFTRIGGNGNIDTTRVVEGRYITWVNAADIHPFANAEYSFVVNDKRYPFRFSIN